MDKLLPRLPFADWIDNGVDWLVSNISVQCLTEFQIFLKELLKDQ